jgi:TolB-like protein/tetratricopeptide (TPR) repeat protein/tRNA A-37 threonylcarbamoyl transferase component Bud32
LRGDDRALVDAAASVADGAPVDWVSAESRADAENRRLVRHLRLVESIASLHRSIPVHDPDDIDSLAGDSIDKASAPGPGGPHWGRLSLLDRIGQGTSCEVYRAWDTALHREVALKLLHDEGDHADANGRVLEEARRLARVRHSHVVQVYGAEQHDGRVGLWMELVRGESLEQTVQTRGTFGAREAALIGLDLCAALAAVHGAGLLHRDIKAQNVMRESGGRLVLMDFGTGEELAGTNRLVGTPLYLAPEIFRGQRASVQSDLYSLGVLLFYLVTGKFPVNAGSMEQLARAHAHRERQPLRDLRPDLPEAFVATVVRALDSDPTRRYQSVGDFESALRELLDAQAGRAAAPAPATAGRPRLGFAFVAAAAVLVALIAGLIVWSGRPWQGDAAIESLAVLPLVDRSGAVSPETREALTEQLIATLGQIQSLRTIALGSTLPFKESERPRAEIAKLLGVDAVLEGTLSADDTDAGRVRLNARLIAAGHDAVLWTGVFGRPRGELAALLADTARALAGAVNAPLTGAEASRLGQVRSTIPEAEEAYLQGRMQLASFGPEPARRALKSFQRAFEIDPSYSAAHAAAARAYLRLAGTNVLTHNDARLSALAEVRTAFDAGGDIAEAHAALGDIKFLYDWDWRGAEREYRRSLDLNPGFIPARKIFAQMLSTRGRFDEAVAISEETQRIDPQSIDGLISHGMLLYYMRDFDGASGVAVRAISQDPANPAGYLLAGRVAEAQGRFGEGFAMMKQSWQLAGDGGVNLRVLVIRLQALSGDVSGARAAMNELEQAAQNGKVRLHARDRALVALGFGDTQQALDAFDLAFGERDPALVWMPVDPRVDTLRSEPRFCVMLEKLSLN